MDPVLLAIAIGFGPWFVHSLFLDRTRPSPPGSRRARAAPRPDRFSYWTGRLVAGALAGAFGLLAWGALALVGLARRWGTDVTGSVCLVIAAWGGLATVLFLERGRGERRAARAGP
ncbi:MAG TPA: hypothetical protein VM370_09280 [Candidatus Thermoplasmatota archaeon]|nr:hypothetical protein [Candidatus Thermoplasmatota archaeon]